MIDYPAITEVFRAWLRDALGIADQQVILARQSGPERTPPYATLDIRTSGKPFPMDVVDTETDLTRPQGEEVEFTVTGHRELTLSIHVYTRGTVGPDAADAMLANARERLELESVVEMFSAAGVSVFEVSDVRDISDMLQTSYRGHAQLDVRFYTPSIVTERTGFIETVEGTGLVAADLSAPRPDPDPEAFPFSETFT